MKKILSLVLILVMTLSFVVSAEGISVSYNEKEVEFTDVTPVVTEENVILVPLRAVFEFMGNDVFWAEDTQTVVCASDEVKSILQIGNNTLFKNSDKVELKTAPVIMNNRTMISLEVVEAVFGVTAEFNETENKINLK